MPNEQYSVPTSLKFGIFDWAGGGGLVAYITTDYRARFYIRLILFMFPAVGNFLPVFFGFFLQTAALSIVVWINLLNMDSVLLE
jgi:hypothetical protein